MALIFMDSFDHYCTSTGGSHRLRMAMKVRFKSSQKDNVMRGRRLPMAWQRRRAEEELLGNAHVIKGKDAPSVVETKR